MPNDMFVNTGIATYIWILSNNKPTTRKGKMQLINASSLGENMRKSLGSKRKYLTETQCDDIVRIYGEFEESKVSKIFNITEFGFRRITVERPLQISLFPHDDEAELCKDSKGKPESNAELRDYEYIPPRSLDDIDAELEKLNNEIMVMLNEMKS